jgi:hypothetical protein
MRRKSTPVWKHRLRVPARNVTAVVRTLVAEKERVCGFYDGRIAQTCPASCRPPRLRILGVEAAPRSVVVRVAGPDVRVNVLSDALAHVLPDDLEVQFPYVS